jgi:hypothetical protein
MVVVPIYIYISSLKEKDNAGAPYDPQAIDH